MRLKETLNYRPVWGVVWEKNWGFVFHESGKQCLLLSFEKKGWKLHFSLVLNSVKSKSWGKLSFAQLVLEISRKWGSWMDPPCPIIFSAMWENNFPHPFFLKAPNLGWNMKMKKIKPFLYRCLGACGSLVSSTHSWISLHSNCNVWEKPNEASLKIFTQE